MPCRLLVTSPVKLSGTLRLAISHHLGLHRLPPVLKQFAQQYPNVTLDIEFMDSEKAYEQRAAGPVGGGGYYPGSGTPAQYR